MLGTLEQLSPQDLVALGVVAFALVTCLVCFPCYLVFVAATGCGPARVQSVCSYILRLAKRRSKFNYHKIDPHVYLGSLPRTMEDLEELKALGVGAIVTLNEAWEMQLSNRFVRDDCGLEHLHLPTPDFFAPKQEDIQAAVQFITAFVSRGIGVYVHCNGGKGRSAVCVICFLASFKEWSPEVAFDHVKSQRRIAPMRGSCCGLHKQWRAVKRFCQQFARKGRREAFADPSNAVSPSNAPLPHEASGSSVRNAAGRRRNDALEDGKEDANCSEVTAKPSELAKIAPAPEQLMPTAAPTLPTEGEMETEGEAVAVPETHVAIAPLHAPGQPLPAAPVHAGTADPEAEYQEEMEPNSSDSEEEPPLLE